MSLDVWLMKVQETEVFDANITHNLNAMADAAGIYKHLWRPDEIEVEYAGELVIPLKQGLARMKADPEKYRAHDSDNGWGTYDDFLPWIDNYIKACEMNPDAVIHVSR